MTSAPARIMTHVNFFDIGYINFLMIMDVKRAANLRNINKEKFAGKMKMNVYANGFSGPRDPLHKAISILSRKKVP